MWDGSRLCVKTDHGPSYSVYHRAYIYGSGLIHASRVHTYTMSSLGYVGYGASSRPMKVSQAPSHVHG
jgi:hypothetical protein